MSFATPKLWQLFPVALIALLSLSSGNMLLAQPQDSSENESHSASLAARQGILLAPRAFRAAAQRVKPSIVVIESFGGSTVASGQISGLRGQGEGNTTGVVLSKDGWIITSTFNFVEQPPVVTVLTADGERRVARLAGRDNTRNLCLLKIEGVSDLKVPDWAPSDELRIGQWAISVGVGYGDQSPAVSAGIISAVARASGRAIQTDANLSPANYGGPLLDIDGRVIGICVPLNPTSPGPAAGVEWYDSGIGFAIPVDTESEWLARLKNGDKLEFGFLGINANNAAEGVRIAAVTEDSPASAADLQPDDLLLTLNDTKIQDTAQLGVELRRYLAGDEVVLGVKREDELLSINVTLGVSPSSTPEIPPVQIAPVTPDEPGR